MSAWSTADALVAELASIRLPHVFNPYADQCPVHDGPGAAGVRRANLVAVMSSALACGAEELWVGQELGRQGGRRTGLPLTDEPRLSACASYWNVPTIARATHGAVVAEQTADFVWRAVAAADRRVFFWNAFPFQCHQPNSALNRGHTAQEVAAVPPILPWLVERLGIGRVVALGRKAEVALSRIQLPCRYVRHPGRGGGPTFLRKIGARG